MKKVITASEVKTGYFIFLNGVANKIRYIRVGPKLVYIKTMNNLQLSFLNTELVEVEE